MRLFAWLLVVGVGCFALGVSFAGRVTAPRADLGVPPNAHGEAGPVRCAASVDRGLLREELARALTSTSVPGRTDGPITVPTAFVVEPPVAKEPRDPTTEEVAAFEQGQVVLGRALRAGRLSTTDSQQLRDFLARMADTARLETMLRVAKALNQEQFQVEGRDLPF